MLKREDFQTQCWKRLSQYVEERIDELRELNDSPSFGQDQTSLLRGRIAELKKILALADEASASPAVSPEDFGADQPGQQ